MSFWPAFAMFMVESETIDGVDDTLMRGVGINWLGFCIQICVGTARPKVMG